ncbi:kinase-like protein, partial [Schizopora paradoxa]
ELYILSKVSHPNIIPFTGYLMQDGYPAIVTPWVEKGDLRVKSIDLKKLLMFREKARGIAEGLKYLHSNEIVHCDLKSPNILISSANRPLLADFGLSRFVHNNTSVAFTMTLGSPASTRWSAPELFDETHFSNATDVWAFGMVLYELMVHEVPYFKQRRDPEIMKRIIMGTRPDWPGHKGEMESDLRQALRDLSDKCWSMIPKNRPEMEFVSKVLNTAACPIPSHNGVILYENPDTAENLTPNGGECD